MNNHTALDENLQRRLTDLADCFDHPCIVNAPTIAQELLGRNSQVSAFTDEPEFADLPGFRLWSITQPVYVADSFDFVLMVVDARVRPAEVFSALRVLTHFHFDTPVVVAAPTAIPRLAGALERFDMTQVAVDEWVLFANFELP